VASLAGIRRMRWDYGQTGLVNAISHERPHEGVAHQSFFPGGPFAVLPLPGNRSSLVWSEESREAARLMALDDAAFTTEVAARIGPRLGRIALAGQRWAYPLDLSLAEAYVAPRLALAGDAAHGVHPIAGQGLNIGLRDVAALAEVLVRAARIGEDIGSGLVLARYQQWRRFDATAFALGTSRTRTRSCASPATRGSAPSTGSARCGASSCARPRARRATCPASCAASRSRSAAPRAAGAGSRRRSARCR